MSFLETPTGASILTFYQYASQIVMWGTIAVGFVSIGHQIYENYKSTRKTKQLFLFQTILSVTMLSSRAAVITIQPSQPLLIFYCHTIFFEILVRYITPGEVLKQFVSLSTVLTDYRINMMHLVATVVHFASISGIFGYYIVFTSPAEDKFMARWFRFGSFINTFYFTIHVLTIFIWQVYLIQTNVNASKSKVSKFEQKKKRLLILLSGIIALAAVTLLQFIVCIVFNAEPPAPGFFLYQYVIQINLSLGTISTFLLPILFDSIIALKFEKRTTAIVQMAHESRLDWKPGEKTFQ